jgi:hypothetical protein
MEVFIEYEKNVSFDFGCGRPFNFGILQLR